MIASDALRQCIVNQSAQVASIVNTRLNSHIVEMQNVRSTLEKRLVALRQEYHQCVNNGVTLHEGLEAFQRPVLAQLQQQQQQKQQRSVKIDVRSLLQQQNQNQSSSKNKSATAVGNSNTTILDSNHNKKESDIATSAVVVVVGGAKSALEAESEQLASAGRALNEHIVKNEENLQQLKDMEQKLVNAITFLDQSVLRDNECLTSVPSRPVTWKDNVHPKHDHGGDGHMMEKGKYADAAIDGEKREKRGEEDCKKNTKDTVNTAGVQSARRTPVHHATTPRPPANPSAQRGRPSTASASSSSSIQNKQQQQQQQGIRVMVTEGRAAAVLPSASIPAPPLSPRGTDRKQQQQQHGHEGQRAGVKVTTAPSQSSLSALYWREEANAIFVEAGSLIQASVRLRMAALSKMSALNLQSTNSRKAVVDGLNDGITAKIRRKEQIFSQLELLEKKFLDTKNVWKSSSEAAQSLKKPISVSSARQELRHQLPDAVGELLNSENLSVREGRHQLKKYCKHLVHEMEDMAKKKHELEEESRLLDRQIATDREWASVANPHAPTAAVREKVHRVRTYPELLIASAPFATTTTSEDDKCTAASNQQKNKKMDFEEKFRRTRFMNMQSLPPWVKIRSLRSIADAPAVVPWKF